MVDVGCSKFQRSNFVDVLGQTTTYGYDALNRMTTLTRPSADTVEFTYDPMDRLVTVTDERTHTTAFFHDGNSRLTNVVDALGHATRFGYDAVDRMVTAVDRTGQPTGFQYDPRGLQSAVTNRNGFVSRFLYDERERLTAVINPAGVTNTFVYDEEGQMIAARNALGETFQFRRDALGYVTNLVDPLGRRVAVARDAMKRMTQYTDALERKTGFAYDRRGLLTNVTLELGITARYHYNPLSLLTNLADPNGNPWRFAYSSMGRQTSAVDPLGRGTGHAYDSQGRLAVVAYPDGSGQTNAFDEVNNLTRSLYSDGTDLHYGYDALNRITNATGSDPVALTYDAMGRITNTRPMGLDFGAAYGAGGRLTHVSYDSAVTAFVVTYTYDSRDRLVHASDNLTGFGMGFAYDDADRLIGITRSNGVDTTHTYDARGLLTRIQHGTHIDIRYTLDAAGQVVEADHVAAPIDPAGVVLNETGSWVHDAASQISSPGYNYDPRGRRTSSPASTLQWDAASRLVGIDAVTLGYNALDDLASREEGGVTHRYFYNRALALHPIVAERNENTGQFLRFYVWAPSGALLYLVDPGEGSYRCPHFDRVGSTLALTDDGGAVTDAYAYDPYGRLLSRSGSDPQPFRFVGQFGVRHEPAGNLDHMRARYYDSSTARFISPEPIWPDLHDPRKLNPYQYAMGNPLSYIDAGGTDGRLPDVNRMKPDDVIDELTDLRVRLYEDQGFDDEDVEDILEEQTENEMMLQGLSHLRRELRRMRELRELLDDPNVSDAAKNAAWRRAVARERLRQSEDPKVSERRQRQESDAKRGQLVYGTAFVPGGPPTYFKASLNAPSGSRDNQSFFYRPEGGAVPVSFALETRDPSLTWKPDGLMHDAMEGQSFDATAGGDDIWSSSGSTSPAGDLDVRVRVETIQPSARWSKAGIRVE